MTLNGVMAITLRYFTEFGKAVLQKTICGGIFATVCIVFLLCVQCRRKESSRSLSHLLMSFLLLLLSCTVTKLWLIIGQIFANESGVPHFIVVAGGDPCAISP